MTKRAATWGTLAVLALVDAVVLVLRPESWWTGAAVGIGVVLAVIAIWQAPVLLLHGIDFTTVDPSAGEAIQGKHRAEDEARRAQAEDNARKTMAQTAGGLALLIGLFFTQRTLENTQRTLDYTRRNLDLAQDGQITERYTKAIQQLGDPQRQVRVGGIYALERIARNSPPDQQTVVDVLATFVRENAPRRLNENSSASPCLVASPSLPASDVQAALAVLARRNREHDRPELLNLRNTELCFADLVAAAFQRADLQGTDFTGAHLDRADLRGAYLGFGRLTGAVLADAQLDDASLERTTGLMEDQLRMAASWQGAHLPPALSHLEYGGPNQPPNKPK